MAAPALPRICSFLPGVRSPGSYWIAGTVTRTARLYWSSSARVLRDVREAVGAGAGGAYDSAVIAGLAERWPGARPPQFTPEQWAEDLASVRAGWRDGEMIAIDTFRALIWFTYVRETPYGSDGPTAVMFGGQTGLPRVGQAIGTTDVDATTRYQDTYNANAGAFNVFTQEVPPPNAPWFNPWCVAPACSIATFNVEAQREASQNPPKKPGILSSGGGILAVGAMTLLLMSGESK